MHNLTNKEKIEKTLNYIRKLNYKIYNVILDDNDDTFCCFQVKGCKNWRFGIWANNNPDDSKYKKVLDVFAQYIPCIDKFTPSRSYYCEEIQNWELASDNWKNNSVRKMINEIKKYPFVAIYHDYYDFKGSNYHVSTPKAFLWFVKNKLENYYNKFS